jgi:DNA-binding transcriptional LysR family regulator
MQGLKPENDDEVARHDGGGWPGLTETAVPGTNPKPALPEPLPALPPPVILPAMSLAQNPPSRVSTNWDDYRYVRAVAETRSLAGAAELLGVNHSTVFRRINAIEDALGARLFERGRAGYTLTPAGEEMVALASRMSEEIVSFERRVAGRDVKPSGELRVTINDTMMTDLMVPVFASFLQACPDIRLDVIVSNASLNLSKRDADIAVRATLAPPEALVGRRVCALAWGVYGPKHLVGRDFADILSERWVGLGDNLSHIPQARWMDREISPNRVVMRVNTILGLAEAIEAGVGVTVLPCFIGNQRPALARLSDPVSELGASLWLLTHPDLKASARVRAFMDHAWDVLSRQRALLEGRAG